MALATREAGKTLADAIAEVREAVDFLRYYADAAEAATGRAARRDRLHPPVELPARDLHRAGRGLPRRRQRGDREAGRADAADRGAGGRRCCTRPACRPTRSRSLPGDGPTVGAPLTGSRGDRRRRASPARPRWRRRSTARWPSMPRPDAVLIAETGGINAMIVDFDGADRAGGARRAGLGLPVGRAALLGAARALRAGGGAGAGAGDALGRDGRADRRRPLGAGDRRRPGDRRRGARRGSAAISRGAGGRGRWCQALRGAGRRALRRRRASSRWRGSARWSARSSGRCCTSRASARRELDEVVEAINARGYGLTCGLHSRIDDRVERVTARLQVGNVYVNRNQIGAIVGSQPFGGEGLSGTGPKAGGPFYLPRLQAAARSRRRAGAGGSGGRGRGARRGLRACSTPATGRRGTTAGRCSRRGSASAGRGSTRRWRRRRRSTAAPLRPAGADRREQPAEPPPARARPRASAPAPRRVLAQAVQALAAGNAVLAVADGAAAALAPLARAAGRRASTGRSSPRRLGALAGPRAGRGRRAGPTGCGRSARALARRDGRDRAARDGAGRARALCRRAPSLHRHDRGRRQRQPARGERVSDHADYRRGLRRRTEAAR